MKRDGSFTKPRGSLLPVVLGLVVSLSGSPVRGQVEADTVLHRGRLWATAVGGGAVIAGTLISLDRAWYSQYSRGPFHFFNDGGEWQGMDKVGHAYATYTVGKWGNGLLRWCGVKPTPALWIGGTMGFTYLTVVEYMDGRSEEWGFSGWDMVANAAGTGLFIGQELGWGEQRITFKYSAHLTDYAPQRPNVLGEEMSERILKDYNGATYWLSANLHSFGARRLPRWLNVSVGYGAEGMLYAEGNPEEYQQFYLAPDIDLQRIRTKSKLLRTLLFTLNCVKVPMPTIEFSSTGEVRGHWLYF